MPDGAAETVLERKAQAQRRALGVGAVSVPRAMGRGFSIAADALWALGLTCRPSADDSLLRDTALTHLSDDHLLIILENERQVCGLVAMDRALVTGLIEVQTLGKVTRFPLDDRPFTPTDAAMVAPLIDAALPRFSSMLASQPERQHLAGFMFGALVEDVATAGLALDAARYQVLTFDADLASETRQGRMTVLLPEPEHDLGAGQAAHRTGKHEKTLMLLPAPMQAVLTRIHIPLSKAQKLKPGDVLEISPNALGATKLIVHGGHIAAKGKLGQINGFRAVRIGAEEGLLHKPEALADVRPAPAPDASIPAPQETPVLQDPLLSGLPDAPPDLSDLV